MPSKYSLNEIIKFAIEIEKEGALFYEKISQKSLNQKSKQVFDKLKNEELIHKKKIENILEMIGPDENYYINHNENEYIAYLHAFIEKVIFKREDINNIMKKINNDYEAIKYAITKEEESIRFYENIKHFTTKSSNSIIDLIISEENLHLSDLLSLKENLL